MVVTSYGFLRFSCTFRQLFNAKSSRFSDQCALQALVSREPMRGYLVGLISLFTVFNILKCYDFVRLLLIFPLSDFTIQISKMLQQGLETGGFRN